MDDNKENYYLQTSKKIKSLINNQEYQEALNIINEELNQVYIPKDFNIFLIECLKECNTNISVSEEDKQIVLSEKEINSILVSSNNKDELSFVLSYLNKVNIRLYFDEIEHFFKREEINNFYKIILLEILKDQNIDRELNVKFNNKDYKINPSNVISVNEDINYIQLNQLISNLLEVKYPSYFYAASELLLLVFSNIFPTSINKQDYEYFIIGLVMYLDELFNQSLIDELKIKKENLNHKLIKYYYELIKQSNSI